MSKTKPFSNFKGSCVGSLQKGKVEQRLMLVLMMYPSKNLTRN